MRRASCNSAGIIVPPTIQASGIAWMNAAYNRIDFNFTRGNGSKFLLIGLQGVPSIPVTKYPKNNDDYSGANLDYSLAPQLPNGASPRAKILYCGTNTSLSVSGLLANTRYCLQLFELNEDNGIYMLNFTSANNSSRSRYTPL